MNYGSSEKVSQRNRAKMEAENAYHKHDYQLSASYYKQILGSTLFADPAVKVNLGHSYFQLKDYKNAQIYYSKLIKIKNPTIVSEAYIQLGWLAYRQKKITDALQAFKKALENNPDNELARYNYELLKKRHPQSNTPPENTPPTTETAPAQQQAVQQITKPAELEENMRKQDILNKLQSFDLSQEKAGMILDAMKNREGQYIQQYKRNAQGGEKMKQTW